MPSRWTTEEELAFLNSKVAGYHQARKDGLVKRYTDGVFEDWFKQYPERPRVFPDAGDGELTEEEQSKLNKAVNVRREQIRSWLGRATSITSRNTATVQLNKLVSAAQGMKNRTRRLQSVEIYQKHFKDELTPLVEDALKDSNATTKQEKMAVRRRVAHEALEGASDETKARIKELRDQNAEEVKGKRVRDKMIVADDTVLERTPEEYDKSIKNLSSLINIVMKPIVDATGWVFYVAAAGPKPDANGDVFMQDYYFRQKGIQGAEFAASYMGFKEGFEIPFAQHVENLFSDEVRAARAMPSLKAVLGNRKLHRMERSTSSEVPEEKDDNQGVNCGDNDKDGHVSQDSEVMDQEPVQSRTSNLDSHTVTLDSQMDLQPQPSNSSPPQPENPQPEMDLQPPSSPPPQPPVTSGPRHQIPDEMIDPLLRPDAESGPNAITDGLIVQQPDYLVPGSVISDTLIQEHPPPEVPTLTRAQKAALTRQANKACAEERGKELEVSKTITGPRMRGGGLNPDGTAIQLPVKRKRAENSQAAGSCSKRKN
ncbi:hypothetical protein H0H93_012946 [Arthromyces matolae]|nr:hypothetical protein H0H93_012946 [Arthromyces matolae]